MASNTVFCVFEVILHQLTYIIPIPGLWQSWCASVLFYASVVFLGFYSPVLVMFLFQRTLAFTFFSNSLPHPTGHGGDWGSRCPGLSCQSGLSHDIWFGFGKTTCRKKTEGRWSPPFLCMCINILYTFEGSATRSCNYQERTANWNFPDALFLELNGFFTLDIVFWHQLLP